MTSAMTLAERESEGADGPIPLPARLPAELPAKPRENLVHSLHDEVLARLREFIVEGNLAPGARVPERLLCERFGISRTPPAGGAEGAGLGGTDRSAAEPRRAGAPDRRAGDCRTLRRDGRVGGPSRPPCLRAHHGRGLCRDRAAPP
ncbi:protein of unknown function [Methylorubrum extorquens]|uniref:HTH gntR-type domain-containing protein n=1 Tax=Methylorubrum extorquens TaxID=408 RepID=A0A2N9AKH3_METEX|nr:protein of unknown function [Methylorubrum extorquens]